MLDIASRIVVIDHLGIIPNGCGVVRDIFGHHAAGSDGHVIEDLEAWSSNLRSRTAIRTSPTRHFTDPSIATAALGTSPSELMGDLNTFGLMFESICIRDLKAYARALEGGVLLS